MILLQIYLIVALVVAIILMLVLRFSKQDFDKFVHDTSDGQIEFTWVDKIVIPILSGFLWPHMVYLMIRKAVHG